MQCKPRHIERPDAARAGPGAGSAPLTRVLPGYADASLVNLTASLEAALGRRHAGPDDAGYGPLALLDPGALRERPKVGLLVVDGLGHARLRAGPAGASLREHLAGRVTSVFPSTTATAITTLMTGAAPQQHAMTGWFMWVRELGAVVAPLPLRSRVGAARYAGAGRDPGALYDAVPLCARLSVACHTVHPRDLVDTPYSRAHAGPATPHGFRDLRGCAAAMRRLLRGPDPCFVLAYWPEFDAISHEHGVASPQAEAHLHEIDAVFGDLVDDLRGAGATLLVTADHGFVDTLPGTRTHLDDHPELERMLAIPLCGEPRVAYCYLRDGCRGDFEAYVRERLAHCCEAVASESLIDAGYFGLGPPHPRLRDRVGDYTLLMHGVHAVKDRLAGERRGFPHVGVHGGLSEAEMGVPLVVATP